mmetsp:Transcript_10297/g.15439  ORF Transcript_10297/g.15439 Transcript_10297/m.15439 type:complete len:184 (+) Transcript_10297:81-632(+)
MVSKTSIVTLLICAASSNAFSVDSNNSNRRSFLTDIATATTAVAGIASIGASPALAAPEIVNLSSGIKYAITRPTEKGKYPNMGDIVFVEYTGYLANGQIFDATHAEGKQNGLLWKLGETTVIPGLNEVVANMRVGEKVQAILPPNMAFGDDGICLENGECLIKPGATLVYDVTLKKTSIPPP